MCIVSAVSDFYRGKYPSPSQDGVSWDVYNEYNRLKRMAVELDIQLHQPDCVKPEVEEWEKEMEKAARGL